MSSDLDRTPASAVRVAVVQVPIRDGEGRSQRIERVAETVAAMRNVDLVVLPELWDVGFARFDDYAAAAEPLGGELQQTLGAAARTAGVELFGGSIVEQADDGLYNTSLLFAADGTLVGSYRKMHLWGGAGSREPEVLQRGTEPVVLDASFGRVGLATCYDLRFPELFRAMLDQGAEVFLIASAWPYPRVEAWTTLLRARAIENLAWVVAANCTGGPSYCGRSAVIDPWGTAVAAAGGEPCVLRTTIDLAMLADVRDRFPPLRDRVPIPGGAG